MVSKKDKVDSKLTRHSADGPISGFFECQFGFKLSGLASWSKFVCLMNRPCHPASLAVFRVCYGVLMLNDLLDERGLASARYGWGDSQICHLPLIHGMEPLKLHWMIFIYFIMSIGCVGLLFGCLFRLSCLMFALPYWYIFLLDRSRWNNHSYLFGLLSIILLLSDANRYWSVDGLIWKNKRNAEVPLWNYFIPRFQLYILYFIAGLKKFDRDWTQGYSMNLASNWVFAPFRLFFSEETVDMIFVHRAGHFIDLTLVYLLFFDATRIPGLILGFSFNFMNATMFSIGMFPYMCIVTLPLFCSFDWPVYWFRKLPNLLKFLAPLDRPVQPSVHCIYPKESIEAAKQNEQNGLDKLTTHGNTKHMKNKIGLYHKFFAAFAIFYAAEQLFLPYSHFITQGYNDWTQGNYGYSWDMMIQTFGVQYAKITYIVKDTGEVGHIKPNAFSSRPYWWCLKADKAIVYAECIEKRLAQRNITNIGIYLDVWVSMTKRISQRAVDSRVNILTAEWHPFKKPQFIYPILKDLEGWRDKIIALKKTIKGIHNHTKVAVLADFPGHTIDNYVQEDIQNLSLTVLHGKVKVDIPDQNETQILFTGDSIQIPSEQFHYVKTISEKPSCFYYTYKDVMAELQRDGYTSYVEELKLLQNVDSGKYRTDTFAFNISAISDIIISAK